MDGHYIKVDMKTKKKGIDENSAYLERDADSTCTYRCDMRSSSRKSAPTGSVLELWTHQRIV